MSDALFVGHTRLGKASALIAIVFAALTGCGGQVFTADGAPVEAASMAQPDQEAVTPSQGSTSAPPGQAASGSSPIFVIRRQPHSVEVRDGEVALFTVAAEGFRAAVSYQWLRDGEPLNGEIGSILQLPATADDHLAKISVLVGSGPAAVQSERVVLRVR